MDSHSVHSGNLLDVRGTWWTSKCRFTRDLGHLADTLLARTALPDNAVSHNLSTHLKLQESQNNILISASSELLRWRLTSELLWTLDSEALAYWKVLNENAFSEVRVEDRPTAIEVQWLDCNLSFWLSQCYVIPVAIDSTVEPSKTERMGIRSLSQV